MTTDGYAYACDRCVRRRGGTQIFGRTQIDRVERARVIQRGRGVFLRHQRWCRPGDYHTCSASACPQNMGQGRVVARPEHGLGQSIGGIATRRA